MDVPSTFRSLLASEPELPTGLGAMKTLMQVREETFPYLLFLEGGEEEDVRALITPTYKEGSLLFCTTFL